jgi:hypothetical protein
MGVYGLPENFFWTTAEVFSIKKYSPQRHGVRSAEHLLINNSLLGALSASALKIVADPSFGGSAVSYLEVQIVLADHVVYAARSDS